MSTRTRGSKSSVRDSPTVKPGSRKTSAAAQERRWKRRVRNAVLIVLAAAGLAGIFLANNRGGEGGTLAGAYEFQVGNPGPGSEAPPIRLPSTDGAMFDLASLRGQKVLLYFQEGLMCQPCWDQIVDLEKQMPELRALGVDRMVSLTTDPLDALRIKVRDEGISTLVLSDPGLGVSEAYEANQYGMMGNSTNGHSFILVDEAGVIQWRADYGGAPDYTMYVPSASLLADLKAGIGSPQV